MDSRSRISPQLRRALVALVFVLLIWLNVRHIVPLMTTFGVAGAADFSIFYVGGRIIHAGLGERLYDLTLQAQFHSPFYRLKPLPFNHPAYELLPFLPLASLPFATAFWIWNAVNAALLGVWAAILAPRLERNSGFSPIFLFVMALAFFPVAATFLQGQDSILALVLFTVAYVCLRLGRAMTAGFVLAMAIFKFPLVVPFVLPWLLRRRWRFAGGFATGVAIAVAVSLAMTGFDGARAYVNLLMVLLRDPDLGYINLRWMPTFRGLMAVLFGTSVAATAVAALLSILALISATLYFRDSSDDRFEGWFALNLFAATLASPHMYPHDLAIVLLAIVLAVYALGGASGAKCVSIVLCALVFCTPLFLYLENTNRLGLMSLPLAGLLLILATTLKRESTQRLDDSTAGQ
jgi:hypothetical protein